jgi:hypothetical protein
MMSKRRRFATYRRSAPGRGVPGLAVLAPASLLFSFACGLAGPTPVDVQRSEAPSGEADSASFIDGDEPAAPTARPDGELCAVQNIPLREVQRPIDIVLVLDNSVSMARELEAIERSINDNFASVLDQRGADYRVILISRHRTSERRATDTIETAICITQPLSSLETCPAERPGLSERFFHYGFDIESTDALERVVDAFDTPDPLYRFTEVGWSEWLREGSRAIFLIFTDDDSLDNGRDITRRLMERDPEHFGSDIDDPQFVFHSVIGIAEREPAGTAYAPDEPIVSERCLKDGELAPASGRVYQTLSQQTGGLRYPLCALDDYASIFEGIARDGIERSGLSCSFPLPAAPLGKRLDTQRIELLLGEQGGPSAPLARVEGPAACETPGFYVTGEQIELCPLLCDQLASLPTTTVSVQFDCDSFVEVR